SDDLTPVRMPHDDSRPSLAGEHLPQPSDVIRQFRHRELWSRDPVSGGLELLDDGAPAGAVRPRAVDEDAVRLVGHSTLLSGSVSIHGSRPQTSYGATIPAWRVLSPSPDLRQRQG